MHNCFISCYFIIVSMLILQHNKIIKSQKKSCWSIAKKYEMLIYKEVRQNSSAAYRLYSHRFPNRPTFILQKFNALIICARKTGAKQTSQGWDDVTGWKRRILDIKEAWTKSADFTTWRSSIKIINFAHISTKTCWSSTSTDTGITITFGLDWSTGNLLTFLYYEILLLEIIAKWVERYIKRNSFEYTWTNLVPSRWRFDAFQSFSPQTFR